MRGMKGSRSGSARVGLLALIAVVLALGACAPTDAGIRARIEAKLAADDVVRGSQIQVEAEKGIVTLTGNIDSPEAKERALTIARQTKGVVEVVDMIAVRMAQGGGDAPSPDRTLGEAIDDATITMRVKGKFLEDPLVQGLQIDVDTREGVVFLTGKVRSEGERDQAVNLARATPGVRDVQANLRLESAAAAGSPQTEESLARFSNEW